MTRRKAHPTYATFCRIAGSGQPSEREGINRSAQTSLPLLPEEGRMNPQDIRGETTADASRCDTLRGRREETAPGVGE